MARVMVVEDDADVRALVVRRLERGGHVVTSASGASEARLLLAESNPPELLVLDVNMPEVTGFDLLNEIRLWLDQDDLPAVFLTGRMDPDDIALGRSLGAVYLTKPLLPNALINAVDALLEP